MLSAAGFVLAGGRSSRMGEDKALAPFGGRPLVARAVGILQEAGLEVAIAGAASPLESFAPVIADLEPGLGPLGGICAALKASETRFAVFLSVDLPLIPGSLILSLLRHAQMTGSVVTMASVCGFAQTFPAVVDRAALPVLEAELGGGRLGCYAAFESAARALGRRAAVVPVEMLAQAGQVSHPDSLPSHLWFLNVNAPEDLRRAAWLLAARIA